MIIVVDDERTFYFDALYLRDSQAALGSLAYQWTRQQIHYGEDLTQLWLDHDLGEDDTIMPVVDFLVLCALQGAPLRVHQVCVHTMNAPAGSAMVARLAAAGYVVIRTALPDMA